MKKPLDLARQARRITTAVTAALAVALPGAASAQGVAFTMRTAAQQEDGSPGSPSTTRVRTRGAVMRFDGVTEGREKGDFGEGAYTLVDAANRRIQVVMPGAKQYLELKFDDSTAMAIRTAAATSGAVADLKVAGQALGGGGTVNGMSTNRFRLTTEFSEMTGGQQRGRRARVVEEYWVSDQMRDVVDPLEQLGRTLGGKGGYAKSPYAALGGSSVNDLLARRAAEQQKMYKGFPVKTVTTSEETDADGDVTRSVTVTEISDVQRGDFDAALFAVPEGYTLFDAKTYFANSVKQAATESAKESAKDAVRGALGGFMRRKKP